MKFCPKCGTQLVDEARFCPKCGAPQPNMAPAEEVKSEPIPAPQPASQPQPQQVAASPRERYNYLMENDEMFRDTTKVVRKVSMLSLINILFLVPFLFNLFMNVGMFTGVDVGDPSAASAANMNFPVEYNALTISTYSTVAKTLGKSLTPGNSLASNPVVYVVIPLGFLFTAFVFLTAFLGKSRGYLLKTYEKPDGKKALLKEARNGPFLLGGFMALFSFGVPVSTYASSMNLDYAPDKHYIFGRVAGLTPNFIGLLVINLIFFAIMVVTQLVLSAVLNRKLKKYREQQ